MEWGIEFGVVTFAEGLTHGKGMMVDLFLAWLGQGVLRGLFTAFDGVWILGTSTSNGACLPSAMTAPTRDNR